MKRLRLVVGFVSSMYEDGGVCINRVLYSVRRTPQVLVDQTQSRCTEYLPPPLQ